MGCAVRLYVGVLIYLAGSCQAALPAASSGLDEPPIANVYMPNERTSLDDCHLRYYKYGQSNAVAPALGQPAYLREFAHMAAIGWTQPDNVTIKWDCGGSLIWENWVLTAAHCASNDNNTKPDVVRFGDLDLYSDADDEFAQQLKIVEVIRHPLHRFSSRYHDIALLRLERNVSLHDTVAPACLWVDDEVRFSLMEATGWGATGYGEAHTPILLKVSLSPVKRELCDQYYSSGDRGLKQGLQDHQMCAGDIKMDTCPGDSGGPLQVRLLHNLKMSPFVVGVTSFGSACGQSSPGVYTRVAPYVTWIQSTLQEHGNAEGDQDFKPYSCALRYAHLREYEDAVVASKSKTTESLAIDRAHLEVEDSLQQVTLQWDQETNENCHGVLIDEDAVVTVANCTMRNGKAPTHVRLLDSVRNDIVQIHNHPQFREHSLDNNIAILKLRDRITFTSHYVIPACIWHSEDIPITKVEVSGIGRYDLNEPNFLNSPIVGYKPQLVELNPKVDIRSSTNCTLPLQYRSLLTNGLQREHLCFGTDLFLVPETCDQTIGGPLQRNIFRANKYYKHVFGINSFGRDCGFGEPAVATRLASHVEWLNSVLLTSYQHAKSAVHFFNGDLKESDVCDANGERGTCVHMNRCPKVRQDLLHLKRVAFCSSGSLVCCPQPFIQQDTTSEAAKELDDCADRYKKFREPFVDYQIDRAIHTTSSSLVYLGTPEDFNFVCSGTLITKGVVLTSATCAKKVLPQHHVLAGPFYPTAFTVPIKEIITHPAFDVETQHNDIALIKLDHPIEVNEYLYPSCLWQNATHTPLILDHLFSNETVSGFLPTFPMYNSDCERSLNNSLALVPSQMCLEARIGDGCFQHGEAAFWYQPIGNGTEVQHIVGIISKELCPREEISVYTRVSSFVGWIKSVL